MTQHQLAEHIGVIRQTVTIRSSSGSTPPSLEVAFRIARVFGVRVDEAFEFIEREGESA